MVKTIVKRAETESPVSTAVTEPLIFEIVEGPVQVRHLDEKLRVFPAEVLNLSARPKLIKGTLRQVMNESKGLLEEWVVLEENGEKYGLPLQNLLNYQKLERIEIRED